MRDPDVIQWFTDRFGTNVRFNELMSKHTSFRIGGPADVFVLPQNTNQLTELIRECVHRNIPYMMIGAGTNLLVKDGGIRGVVIRLSTCNSDKILVIGKTSEGVIVRANAGIRLSTLCAFAIEQGLYGMNAVVGIPGTVGGGVIMNAGTALGSIGDALESVTVLLPDARQRIIPKRDLKLEYRRLSWNESLDSSAPVCLSASFSLTPSDPVKLRKEAQILLKQRKQKQPLNLPSPGCFFKNPFLSDKQVSAGYLIDKAGLKGRRIGGAEISPKHANFIVNTGNASAVDVIQLMELIKETVRREYGVELQAEVKIVGE